MKSSYIDAIVSLVPNAEVSCIEETGEITWYVPKSSPVTMEQIEQERERLGSLIPLTKCKQKAKQLLAACDWSVLPDVNISNKSEFEAYRATIREYIINPVANPVFPNEPQPVWI